MFVEKYENLAWAHPLVREWFLSQVGPPTLPQSQGWSSILKGQSTLISAPTGSGKTLAAFLVCIDQLVRQSLAGELKDQIEVLYISPLKALSNDVQKNLMVPLTEILELAKKKHLNLSPISTAVRTGDTVVRERQAMLKKPPHILVTTPESLYILLTAEKSRLLLTQIKTIIVDEIHAIANDKRGTHLSLSLERLEALTPAPPIRIGLSATQKPIEKIARFLIGNERKLPTIIQIGHQRKIELTVSVPLRKLDAVTSNEMWDEIYDKIATQAKQNRSTLVFVNTRRLAERVAHHLSERLGKNKVAAHHGSLSRKLRLAVENKLKEGHLTVLVATASLELGIDIGTIDLVCQIGSPRAIAIALQRIGRAGHWHGAISKGNIFATTRDELLECAALCHAILAGELDELIFPQQPLDVLAQQMIATCSTESWQEEALLSLFKKSFSYGNLSQETFYHLLEMFSSGLAGLKGKYGTYLLRDQVNKMVKARRGSRLTAITNAGTIPETGLYTVTTDPEGVVVGTLDEDFAVESQRGDIILLGSTSWVIKRVESGRGRVIVEDAHGAPPSVPFWRGESPGRTKELSQYVSKVRQILSDLLPDLETPVHEAKDHPKVSSAINWIKTYCCLDEYGAEQLLEYIRQGKAMLGEVPTQEKIIAERFFDESGGMQLIIHSPFGARINKAWGLALRKRFCRSFNFELQAAATDDGLNISLAEQHSFPLSDVFQFLHPNTVKEVLVQAILQSPLFATRWRAVVTRSLAIARYRWGKKTPPPILRMLSDDLLAAIFPDAAACQDNLGGREIELPDHPLVNETIKEILHDALDLEGLTTILKKILNNQIKCLAIDTPSPSPFAHEILNANPYAFLDDAPLEERRARAVALRRVLPESILKEMGHLTPESIHEVQEQAWPDIRNADELHDVLQTLIVLPPDIYLSEHQSARPLWQQFFDELVSSGRAGLAILEKQTFWLATEKLKTFMTIYPNAILQHQLQSIEKTCINEEEAILCLIRGWMLHIGPITNNELSLILKLKNSQIEQALLTLESSGLLLRGHFRKNEKKVDASLEWCERRLLARIHKLTISRLRKEIKPIVVTEYIKWLLKWQHVAPNTQLCGELGLLEIIKQLQGFELPANAWESQIFSKRIKDFNHSMLDQLCLSGKIGWGRISTHPVLSSHLKLHQAKPEKGSNKTRILPTASSPITFFIRESSDWIPDRSQYFNEEMLNPFSHTAKIIYHYLEKHGASFFSDILRNSGKLKIEIETGLWELAVAGLITADSFDNLRALIDPRRRVGKKRNQRESLYHGARWSLLKNEKILNEETYLEACCWVLLKRYGVVFRELLTREKNSPKWQNLVKVFRYLEDRGEIRGGRFIDGLIGEQFALPSALHSLRATQKSAEEEIITVSAADPLNLQGIILPGPRIAAVRREMISL